MLEAVHTDLVFTISLKRSTQNLQLSTSCSADYPIYWYRQARRKAATGDLAVEWAAIAGALLET